jgi:hypothetical protein
MLLASSIVPMPKVGIRIRICIEAEYLTGKNLGQAFWVIKKVPAMQHDDISLALLLFRYWWPFWFFQDASHGDLYMRAAAYRHNRERRVYLPGYLAKWLFICALALTLTSRFELLAAEVRDMAEFFTCLAAGSGVGFAFGICVLIKTGYIYLYLSGHEH